MRAHLSDVMPRPHPVPERRRDGTHEQRLAPPTPRSLPPAHTSLPSDASRPFPRHLLPPRSPPGIDGPLATVMPAVLMVLVCGWAVGRV